MTTITTCDSPRLPNFLIIGAAKSGTTSLHAYLAQHPDIFFPRRKEPNYFAFAGATLPPPGPADPETLFRLLYDHSVTDFDSYRRLFESVTTETAIGEASVRYLYFPNAPQLIRETIPDVRLVAMLREPVSRLYSHYNMMVQFHLEPLDLLDAIEAEDERRDAGWGWDWHYVSVGQYAKQLQRYVDQYARDQIKVVLYDDFLERPLELVQAIYRHLAVDDRFVPDMTAREKVASRPRSKLLGKWLNWPDTTRVTVERLLPSRWTKPVLAELDRRNRVPVPPLDPQVRSKLQDLFREDVLQLEALLEREIPWYR